MADGYITGGCLLMSLVALLLHETRPFKVGGNEKRGGIESAIAWACLPSNLMLRAHG